MRNLNCYISHFKRGEKYDNNKENKEKAHKKNKAAPGIMN